MGGRALSVATSDVASPELLHAVPVGAIKADVAAVAGELATLSRELRELQARATALEQQAAVAPRAVEGGRAGQSMLDSVFREQARSARAGLAESLELAEQRATTRVVSARAEARRMLADARSVADAGHLESPGASETTQERRFVHEVVGAPHAHDEDPSVDATFWSDETPPAEEDSRSKLPILDLVLPMAALVIVVLVAMSWIS